MGFVDRITDIGGGLLEGAWQAPMLAVDIARGMVMEDEYEGLLGTISGSLMDRGAHFLENTIGPDRGLGAAIGAIPEAIGVRQGANGVLAGMEFAAKEIASQPMSTLMTMGSLADSEGWGVFTSGEHWKQAYEIAETRSLGQAVMLAYGTKNILDEREVARYQLTDHYWWTTGIIDATIAMRFDPTAMLGKGLTGARAASSGSLSQGVARGGAFLKGNTKVALRGTAQEASEAANLRMTIGGLESQKRQAFVNTVRRTRAGITDDVTEGIQSGVAGENIFQLYMNSSRPQQKALRSQLWAVTRPRALADGSGVTGQIDDFIKSHRFTDVDTAVKSMADDLGTFSRTVKEENILNLGRENAEFGYMTRSGRTPTNRKDVQKIYDQQDDFDAAFLDAGDDDLVWVFHGTQNRAEVAATDAIDVPAKKRFEGTSGGIEGEDGLYVSANPNKAEEFSFFGEEDIPDLGQEEGVFAMLIRKGDLKESKENFVRQEDKALMPKVFSAKNDVKVRNEAIVPNGVVPLRKIDITDNFKDGVDNLPNVLKQRLDSGGEAADIARLASRIRHTILNSEKSIGGVGQASEVLARAYLRHPEDLQLHQDVWRALMGDQAVLSKMHKDLQGILKLKGTLADDADRVAMAELLKSHMVSGQVRRTLNDSDTYQKTVDFIIENEDVYPSEILADLVESAMIRGDDEFANFIVDASDQMEHLGRLEDSFRGPRGGKPRGKRATEFKDQRAEIVAGSATKLTRFVEKARMGGDDLGVGWNEARLDALMEEAGRSSVVEALFTTKARSNIGDAIVAPQLREVPRVTRNTAGRVERVSRDTPSVARRVASGIVDSDFVETAATGFHLSGVRSRYSATLQSDASMRPFRMFTNMMPHRVIDVVEDKSDVQMQRILDQVRVPTLQAQELRGKYMLANTPAERLKVFEEIEVVSFQTIANRHGLDAEDVQIVMDEIKTQKMIAHRALEKKNLRYDADLDRHYVRFATGDEMIEYPITVTETSKHVAVPDWRSLDRAVKRRANRIRRHQDTMMGETSVDITASEMQKVRREAAGKAVNESDDLLARRAVRKGIGGLDAVMQVWTPAQLLRPAWTMKVVMVDERLRQLAKFGGMVTWMDQMNMARNSFHDLYREFASNSTPSMRLLGVDQGLTTGQSLRRSSAVGALFGGAVGGLPGAAIGGAAGGLIGKNYASKLRQVDSLPFSLSRVADGVEVQGAMGNGIDDNNIWKELVSVGTSSQFRALRGHTNNSEVLLREFRATGNYVSVSPKNQTNWKKAFTETFNNQIGQDTGARRAMQIIIDKIDNGDDIDLLKDDVADELANWMKNTRDGKKYSSQLPARSFDDAAKQGWSDVMVAMLYDYMAVDGRMGGKPGVPRDTTLLKKLIDPTQGSVTPEEWMAEFTELGKLPHIHGAEIGESLGKSGLSVKISDYVESAYQVMGRIPSDTLSRQPMFNHLYRLEMKRMLNTKVDDLGNRVVSKADIAAMQRNAREYALTETRQVMYELAESSEFGELARLVMPFFSAWQEALTRYSGLAYENPAFMARAVRGFDSFSQDEEGNRYLQFTLPEWAASLANEGWAFKGAFENNNEIKLGVDSLNMIANGLPGTGPIVQYPLARAAQSNPGLEDSLSFIFPYGPPESFLDGFLPAYGRRLKSLKQGDDDRAYASQLRRNMKTKLARMESGEIPFVDMNDPIARREFIEELEGESRSLMAVRLFASFVSPVTTTFDSPYQVFIEGYRELQESSDTADEDFLDAYGEDFFALTTATTRTTNGVPPTMHGIQMEEKYQDLIDAHPELGRLIIGADGGGTFGEFIRSKYIDQIDEGDRQLLSLDEMATAHTTKLGWVEYSRTMDFIDFQMNDRGLPNLRVKDAEDLANMKRSMISNLAQTNPGWAADFYSIDRGKWDRRIKGLEAIAAAPGLGALDDKGLSRMDLAPLQEYLSLRRYVVGELAARKAQGGPSTLDASGNADIAEFWEQSTNKLVEENLAFADLFYRYLDNDPVRGPLSGATLQGSL